MRVIFLVLCLGLGTAGWAQDLVQVFRSGSLDAVQKTIEAGTSVETRFVANGQVTPLMFAARYNTTDVVTYLLKVGAKTDDRDAVGWTALNWALVGGKFDNASLLEKAGTKLAVLAKTPGAGSDLVEVKTEETTVRKAEVDRWAATLTGPNASLDSDKLDRILEELRLLKLQVADLEAKVASGGTVPVNVTPTPTVAATVPFQVTAVSPMVREFPAYVRFQSSMSLVPILANDLVRGSLLIEQTNDVWFEPKPNHLVGGWSFQGLRAGVGFEALKIRVPGSVGWYGWQSPDSEKGVGWPFLHLGAEVGSWLTDRWYQSLDASLGFSPWVFQSDGGYALKYHWNPDFASWVRVGASGHTLMPSETTGSQVFGATFAIGFQVL